MKRLRLFVIRNGEGQYWTCSSEHGSGWHGDQPKQAFSPSELARTIRLLIDQGWWQDCEVLELRHRETVASDIADATFLIDRSEYESILKRRSCRFANPRGVIDAPAGA